MIKTYPSLSKTIRETLPENTIFFVELKTPGKPSIYQRLIFNSKHVISTPDGFTHCLKPHGTPLSKKKFTLDFIDNPKLKSNIDISQVEINGKGVITHIEKIYHRISKEWISPENNEHGLA
jgi:hypothetical protein